MRLIPTILSSLVVLTACQPVIGPTVGAVANRSVATDLRVNVRFASAFGVQGIRHQIRKTSTDVVTVTFELLNANDADAVVAAKSGTTGTSFNNLADGSYKIRATALAAGDVSITQGTPPVSGIITVASGVVTYPGTETSVTLTVPLWDGTGERVAAQATVTGSGTPDAYIYQLLKASDSSQVASYTSTSKTIHFTGVPDGTYKLTADARKGGASITTGGAQTSGNTVTVANGQVTYSDDGSKFLSSLTVASMGTWSSKAAMPAGLLGGAMAATATKLYYLGGAGNSGPSNAVYEYDPTANTWATMAHLPGKRQLLSAVSLSGKVYAIGGNDGITQSAAMFVYDPVTDRWTLKRGMPKALFSTAAAAVGDQIYVVGGNSFDTGVSDTVYAYDPGTNTWSTKASLPKGLASPAAVAVGGKLYVLGGGNDDGDSKSVYAFDPATDTWTSKADMAATRKEFAAAPGPDGLIYVTGGTVNGSMSSSVQAFDPVANAWSTKTALPTSRYVHSAAALGGKIYLAGGFDPTYMPLAGLLAFDP